MATQSELGSLLAQQRQLDHTIADVRTLQHRISETIAARDAGNGRMQLPVDLGMGYTVDGVIEDTSTIICSLGTQDLWVEFTLEQARDFLNRRLDILERKKASVDQPLAELRSETLKVSDALRKVLELGTTEDTDAIAQPHA
ncbi:hypothetical protein OIV83_003397 [Microbotryomycetes sp. JL201]|nr:hypothetical protein OIV83_003397 [Microbotryomycetes sp. JL201]